MDGTNDVGQYSIISQQNQRSQSQSRYSGRPKIKTETIRVKTTGENRDDWVILVISLLIIIIFWAIIAWKAIITIPSIQTSTGTQVLVECPPGQCATNLYNGEKRCPDSDEGTIVSNAGVEVCSSRYLCDSLQLPFAVNIDGSTNVDGVCDDGVTCRCLSGPQCPEYITSYFYTIDGNPYMVETSTTRTTFGQLSESTNPYTGITTTNRPFELDNNSTQFCTVPSEWLIRSNPGCEFSETMDIDTAVTCMSYQTGVDGVIYSPCLQGTLAFVMNDSSEFDSNSVDRVPMGCVAAPPCDSGMVAIWDLQYNNIVCRPPPVD